MIIRRNLGMSIAAAVLTALAATGSAWADAPTGYATLFSEDFENVDTYTNHIKEGAVASTVFGTSASSKDITYNVVSGPTTMSDSDRDIRISWEERAGSNPATHYLRSMRHHSGSNGAIDLLLPFSSEISDLSDYDDYILEFDTYIGPGYSNSNGGPSGVVIKGSNGVLATIYVGTGSSSGTTTAYVYAGDSTDDANKIGTFNTGSRGSYDTPAYWLHVVVRGYPVSADENYPGGKVTLAVTQPNNNNASIVSETVVSSAIQAVDALFLHAGNCRYRHCSSLDDVCLYVPAAEGTPNAPSVSVDDGAIDDLRLVTITQDANASPGSRTYYYLQSEGISAAVEYTEPFYLQSSDVVVAYTENGSLTSEQASLYVQAGVIGTPTAAITGVNCTSRTATFYSDYALEYNTTAADGAYVDYSAPIVVNDSTTFYVRAKKTSTVDANVTLYSAVLTFAVTAGAGNTVKLAAPEIRVRGFNKIYLHADESGVEGAPQGSVIHYAVNGVTQTDTVTLAGAANGDGLVPVTTTSDGTVVTAWVTCDGYDNSDTTTFTYVKPIAAKYARRYEVDIVAYTSEHTNAGVVQDNNLKEDVEIGENTYTFFKLKFNGEDDVISENLLPIWEIGSNGSLRWSNLGWSGLYSYSTTKRVALKNLKAGDVVYVAGTGISLPDAGANLVASEDAHLLSVDNSGYERYYVVQSDGAASFQIGRDGLLFAVRVYKPRKGFVLILQ